MPTSRTYKLTIIGTPVAYTRTTQKAKFVDERYARYAAWKDEVRLRANLAGIPSEIGTGQSATIRLGVWWPRMARADLDNNLKGLIDALFRDDRRVTRIEAVAHEWSGQPPRMEIELEINENKKTIDKSTE